MSDVHHQPNLAADLFGLWRLPLELAAESAIAAGEIMAGLYSRRSLPHSGQLPVPEPIEEHGEHNLFA